MSFQVLDCTIRDGGHLNHWKFSPSSVKAAYYAAVKSGVEYFEIGYRNPESRLGLGPFGYCTDQYIGSLIEVDDKCKLLIMVDAGKSADIRFAECNPSYTPIKGVRVAAYPTEFEVAFKLIEKLKELKYEVFLNLMASSEISDEQFLQLENWKCKEYLESLNFADSFGSFIPSNITSIINRLRSLGYTKIGFHSHNNLQMAFANSLKAIEEGVSFIDASIMGMGRGAGNLPIEILLGYLEKDGNQRYNTVPYLDVIDRYFNEIFTEYNWGYKLSSLISGLTNIHPYYIDELFNRKSFTIQEIWNATNYIKSNCPTSFSVEKLNNSLSKRFYNPVTPESATKLINELNSQLKIIPAKDAFVAERFKFNNKHRGQKILVIANGPSILEYKDQIDALIECKQLVTVGVNYLRDLFAPDYHVFVSQKRLLKYAEKINDKSTLLIPSFFGRSVVSENYSGIVEYFNIETVEDKSDLAVHEDIQRCVHLNVSISAILLAYLMGASEIYAVGIDGYIDEMQSKMVFFYKEDDTPDDKDIASLRYELFAEELDRVNKFLQEKSVPFSIITPTSHKKFYRNIFNK